MALASPRVRSTSIEAREFPEVSGHYEVYSVPKIIVNDSFDFTGGLPEAQFVDAVLTGSAPDAEKGEIEQTSV